MIFQKLLLFAFFFLDVESYFMEGRVVTQTYGLNMTLCSDLEEEGDCARRLKYNNVTMPYLNPRLSYVARIEEPKFKHYGRHSEFIPYDCHLMTPNETPNKDNAFIIAGESVVDGVSLLYIRNKAARIEFEPHQLLHLNRYTPYKYYQYEYRIECLVAECSCSPKGYKNQVCPDYTKEIVDYVPEEGKLLVATMVHFRLYPFSSAMDFIIRGPINL